MRPGSKRGTRSPLDLRSQSASGKDVAEPWGSPWRSLLTYLEASDGATLATELIGRIPSPSSTTTESDLTQLDFGTYRVPGNDHAGHPKTVFGTGRIWRCRSVDWEDPPCQGAQRIGRAGGVP